MIEKCAGTPRLMVAYIIIYAFYAYLFSLVWTPCFKTTGLI
jgi:hypothetical protein